MISTKIIEINFKYNIFRVNLAQSGQNKIVYISEKQL